MNENNEWTGNDGVVRRLSRSRHTGDVIVETFNPIYEYWATEYWNRPASCGKGENDVEMHHANLARNPL